MSALPLAPYTKSSTPLPKAATVTSQPQAGKSCFGSWQRKLSRSLALTSCCHGAEKLQEQPHTKDRRALPKGKGFLVCFFFSSSRMDCTNSHSEPCKSRLSFWTFHGAHCRVFKHPWCPLSPTAPPPSTTIFPAECPLSTS